MERIYAVLLLAWSLLRSLLAPFFGLRRGLVDFERSYAPDRLAPLTEAERRLLPMFSGCIACGRCNVGEGARIAASRGAYAGTMDLVLSASRSMPDFDAAALSFAHVDDTRLEELEAICPGRVPLRALAAFVRNKARSEADPG